MKPYVRNEMRNMTLFNMFEEVLRTASTVDIGKVLAPLMEIYIKNTINKNTNLVLIPSTEKNNGPGYDAIDEKSGLTIQSKFRQVNGVTPLSKQLHFENTRRKSKKNQGNNSKSGHTVYGINESDVIVVFIMHIKDEKQTIQYKLNHGTSIDDTEELFKDCYIVAIPTRKLEDPDNIGCCMSKIPSKFLEVASDWVNILNEEQYKKINNVK